ncbi:MAG: DUF2203 domain-containing protein [Candidatus Binatia bacterium]|jgi:hypothetical protein
MESSDTFPRLFTVDEANALLPIVRPLIEKILDNVQRLRTKSETLVRETRLDPEAADFMDRLQEDGEIARLVGEVRSWVEEINRHGCMCKGVEQGLIDFPCLLGAEVVFLCWRLGEPKVGHWHRIEEGFVGRRSLLDVDKPGPDGSTSYH